jgi:hypothetical protein
MGQITQYTVPKFTQLLSAVAVRLDGGSRTVIRVEGGDVRLAYQRDLLGSDLDNGQDQYFTIKDGEAFVFDPNPLTGTTEAELGYTFYMTTTAVEAYVQIWLQGATQGVGF